MPEDNTVMMEGVRIIFRNFEGKPGLYNQEGDHNFGVLLDATIAQTLIEDGWNVKVLKSREEDEEEEEQPWLPVFLKYQGRNGPVHPPTVVVLTSTKRRNLKESELDMLDWADIKNVDLIVRPFSWEVNGKTGIKAYVKSLFITIEEDALEQKYADYES